ALAWFPPAPGCADLTLFCRCASANGSAASAVNASRMKALRIICALMEEFCFFMVLCLVICEIRGSNPLRVLVDVHRGENAFSGKRKSASTLFLYSFRNFFRGVNRGRFVGRGTTSRRTGGDRPVERGVLNALANECGLPPDICASCD